MRVGKTSRPGSVDTARWRALRLLERRPQSERELLTKLAQRGFEPRVVTEAVAKLKESGLVDDAAFAAAFARSRVSRKPVGRRLVERQLAAKGIDRKLAVSAAEAAVADRDEALMVREAAVKYLRRHPLKFQGRRGLEAARERSRMFGWLLRQGFSGELVRRAVAGAEDDDDLG